MQTWIDFEWDIIHTVNDRLRSCLGAGCGHFEHMLLNERSFIGFLWPHCVAHADIVFLPCDFCLSSPNLSGRRLDVNHTSTHSVA